MVMNGRRVESPSSINTYKQCPRKYFHQYVEKLPTGTSIHLIRGNLVHKALEDFFDLDMADSSTQSFKFLHLRLFSIFTRHWKLAKSDLEGLGLNDAELKEYFDESIAMLQNWFNRYKGKMEKRMESGNDFFEAYNALKPLREEEYASEEFMVRGFIDAIHKLDGKTVVLDYKTSKRTHISSEYRLQLAIYALLYEEKHGKKPDFVGIDFLKSIEQVLPVDDELISHARFEIEQIHASTKSDSAIDYPQRPSPLCKWRTGQCDFYDVCFGGVSSEDFLKKS